MMPSNLTQSLLKIASSTVFVYINLFQIILGKNLIFAYLYYTGWSHFFYCNCINVVFFKSKYVFKNILTLDIMH